MTRPSTNILTTLMCLGLAGLHQTSAYVTSKQLKIDGLRLKTPPPIAPLPIIAAPDQQQVDNNIIVQLRIHDHIDVTGMQNRFVATPLIDIGTTSTNEDGNSDDSSTDTRASPSASGRAVDLQRKKWGVDRDREHEYWFDDRIHSLGNRGFGGALHAAMAPFATRMIDVKAYDGVNVRQKVADELCTLVGQSKARVVDLCCGVGFSTRALQNAFHDSDAVIGMDTSPEMLAMAEWLTGHIESVKKWRTTGWKASGNKIKKTCAQVATFLQGNAEDTQLPDESFDLATVMYAFHEVPMAGRDRILEEARRLLRPGGTLAVVDISTDYEPSPAMLHGEPYVQAYQQNICKQLATFKGFLPVLSKPLVEGHVNLWVLRRDDEMPSGNVALSGAFD